MKPWFRKKQSKFSERIREDGFFDCGDDRDPWASSAIDFFSRNKNIQKNECEKEAPVLSRSDASSVDHMDPISFPQLNASYEKIRKKRIEYEQEGTHQAEKGEDPWLDASQAHIPDGRKDAKYENTPSLSAFSACASEPQNSNEFSPRKEIQFDLKQRLFEVGGLKASMQTSYTDPFQKLTATTASNPKITLSNPPVNASNAEPQPLEKDLENDHPSVMKIILIAVILVFVIGILWLIYSQNDYDEGEVMVIKAPSIIKVAPEKTTKPLVPYQDELIYGKLEDFDEKPDSEGEQILPQTEFAPPPPEISEHNDFNEEFSDYLEYSDSPKDAKMDAVPDEEIIDIRPELSQKKPKISVSSPSVHQTERMPKTSVKTFPYSRMTEKPVKSISPAPALKPSRKLFFVQLGTLPSKEMATAEMKRLRSKYKILSSCGLITRQFQLENREKVYRILAGPFLSKEQALKLKQILGARYRVIE